MTDRRTVLVPLDGSDLGQAALDALVRLFDPADVQLVLLHVGDAPPHPGSTAPTRPFVPSDAVLADAATPDPDDETHVWDSQEWASARAELEDVLAPVARRLRRDGWEVETATAFGDPAPEIVRTARDRAPDLVAMATHGRTGVARALVGSVAERALRRLGVPVLMVRPDAVRDEGDVETEAAPSA